MKSQKVNIFKIATLGLLGLSMVVGCSSGNGNSDEGSQTQKIVAEQSAQQQAASVEAWGKFVGLDPQTAKQILSNVKIDDAGTSVNLLDRIGKTSQLDAGEFKAFMLVTFKADSTFANGIEVLNQQNTLATNAVNNVNNPLKVVITEKDTKDAKDLLDPATPKVKSVDLTNKLIPEGVVDIGDKFSGDKDANTAGNGTITVTPTGGEDSGLAQRREDAKVAYQKLSAETTLLRNRVVDGAALLGFQLTPASMRDMLVDSHFLAIRDAFIEPTVKAIFDKSLDQATEEEKNFAAEPLASVSFLVGQDLLSFYEFSPQDSEASTKSDSSDISFNRGLLKLKGRFFVRPAADNLLIIAEDGGLTRGPIGGIKK